MKRSTAVNLTGLVLILAASTMVDQAMELAIVVGLIGFGLGVKR